MNGLADHHQALDGLDGPCIPPVRSWCRSHWSVARAVVAQESTVTAMCTTVSICSPHQLDHDMAVSA
jgi:hypothetical protein